MKSTLTSFLTLILLITTGTAARAQFAFGIESSVCKADEYPGVSLPAATLREIGEYSADQIKAADLCIETPANGIFSGYQADYDGDGAQEMWLLYHSGPEDAGCTACVIVSPIGGGKYQLQDLFSVHGGNAVMRPIRTLDKGVQMYLQTTQTKDGVVEVQGSVLAYQQTALIILTSWVQRNGVVNGKHIVEKADAVFRDMNFDNTKELIVRYSMHETGGGGATESNLTDRFILTLDFLPNHLRYGVYDSVGMAELSEAESKATAGRRQMNREETRIDGIVQMREALETNPFLTSERVHLAEFLLHDGKYADAEKTLIEAAEFEPSYAKTYRILGDTYLRLNDLQKALDAYNTYLALGPESSYYEKKVEQNIKNITIPRKKR